MSGLTAGDTTAVELIHTGEVRLHPGLRDHPAYLDYNATTPVDPRVSASMSEALTTHFGNPSSTHVYGQEPRRLLDQARAQVAGLVGAAPGDVVFTGSGTEADALAIRGVVLAHVAAVAGRPHVVTQATEHPAVLAACEYLRRHHGVAVTSLRVDRHGRVDPAEVDAALTPRTVLVSVMHANNETGTVQPLAEIAEVCRERGVLLHSDAAQSVGKVDVDVGYLGVDLLTVVGHKMYAPKGIAALVVRPGVVLEPLVGGGGQERGLRAGTESVALAVALGTAAELAGQALAAGETRRLAGLRDLLATELEAGFRHRRVTVNGHPQQRLPNTLSISVEGVAARQLLAAASGVAASTGSACHADREDPSAVLTAMGVLPEAAASTMRLSLGRWSTEGEVTAAAREIVDAGQ